MVFETGSATVPSTGTLAVVTQATLASATWATLTPTGLSDYSLTSSSALFIANTLYFAGQASASAGAQTCTSAPLCTLNFWSLSLTSMTVAASSVTEQTIETTHFPWMAALTSSGTTLSLFDAYPTSTTVQYYTSATLGSIWNTPAITLESAETAVNGLMPAVGGFAVTWANSANNVRFAALSTFTVTNNTPFAVHLVDLYIYNSATNSLVAHYYLNSTEDFDYYVGQGSSMVLPIRFIWAASTSYLVTTGTDTGVDTQLTVTSPPAPTVTCTPGYFGNYQIAPGQTCSSVPAAAAPVVTESTSSNTCTDATTTTTEMMDLGVSYTTTASSAGNIHVTLTFNVGTPATAAGLTSKWTLAYGTGTVPACNNGSPQGTTVGQQYTIQTEVAAAGSMAQSEVVTLNGLSPSTAYWFDVQVSDSSGANWIYSLASMAVNDEQVSGLRTANFAPLQTPTESCTVSSATTEMAGFATSYTTGASGAYSGNLKVSMTFNIASPATAAGLTGKWQLAYGTGTAPACDAAAPAAGFVATLGDQYTVETVAAATLSESQIETVSVTDLQQSTTYWFDLQITDSSAASWVYSSPTMAVTELPTINNLPPNYNFSPNAGTCTDTTTTTTLMEGDTYYTTTSPGTGTALVHLTFNVGTPLTAAGLTSKWQLAYGAVTTAAAAPACNAASAGTTVGNQYTIETLAAAVGSTSQSEGAVITGLSHGTEYWFALRVTDSSGASWVYSNPEIQVTEVMPATVPHDNTVSVSNPNSCSDTTTAAATMMGFATVYSTLSYGTGTIAATLTWKLTMPNTASDTATYLLTYGTGAPPGCVGALTGTTVGQTYEFLNPAAVATQTEPSITITISGLAEGTTYWFDIRVNPSVTATVSSLPVLTVVEVI